MESNRPWVANYPTGMPANINPDAYENLVAFFEDTFAKYGNAPAFENMGKQISYKELDKMSTAFGAYLQNRGLEPGDRFAIMMPNCLQYPIAVVGALKAGLIVVNTNPLYTRREMLHQFQDSEVKGILIIENFAHSLEGILKETSIKVVIRTSIGEMLGTIKGAITDFVVRKVKKMVPTYSIPNTVTFQDALKVGSKHTIKKFTNTPEDVIFHQYTGGTTGVAKGAMLTNRNLIANMFQMQAVMKVKMKDAGEVCLCPLPMYHIFALMGALLAMPSLGALTILVTNPRDLKSVFKEFKSPVTLFMGLNTLFNAMLNSPLMAQTSFKTLKATIGGGMAVQVVVAERWEKMTGQQMIEGFGMTETSPVASVNPFDGRSRYGTIGMPIPSTDMKIVDEEGHEVPLGERGELIVKGPQVMAGYYKRPKDTEEVIKDGWMYTGDIGIQEPDGYFKIVDRKKDMILVSGFNVYPNEIEDEVIKNEKVMEVAAVGIPNDKSGEVVKLFVVKKDPSLTAEEIINYCKSSMTGYKVPKEVEFRDELPKSNVGKILRRQLRDN
jgi:long-chain acyl-CoA synthetase